MVGIAVVEVSVIAFRRKKTIKFAWEKYHGRKEAEPIDWRDRLGRGELAGFVPP